MSIEFKNNRFHLYNDEISYVMEVSRQNDILNLHYGASVNADDLVFQSNVLSSFHCYSDEQDESYSLSFLPQEYPSCGFSFRDILSPSPLPLSFPTFSPRSPLTREVSPREL